jgi:RNA polymerase sigma-70 factor (ECF subfamily)
VKRPAGEDVEALLARARRGERAAFGALTIQYRKRLFALALQLVGNTSDAEDVVQEALLRAYRALPSWQARSQFGTWLYRIAVNCALSQRRRAGRARERVRLDDDRVRAAVAVDGDGDPGHAAQLAESYALLLTALDALSPGMRTTVVLVALQGLSHREAAAVAGTTEGTIAWRMHEARRLLQQALAPVSEVRRKKPRGRRPPPPPPKAGKVVKLPGKKGGA